MEKLLKPYDKEYMKMAILKHEETFREQVYELHRLYQIQKTLMKNIENNRPNGQNQDVWNSKNAISLNQIHNHHETMHQKLQQNLDLERPAKEYIAESDGNGVVGIEDESKIELTLGRTSYYRRGKADTPLTSESGLSFSSSSTGSSHIKRTSSGIHQTRDTTRGQSTWHKWGFVEMPQANPNFVSGNKNSNAGVQEQLRQDKLEQPQWLFQVLSLNMT